MIKLSNITKVFQQGTRTIQALNNVSLHVPAGQIYGVMAPPPVKYAYPLR